MDQKIWDELDAHLYFLEVGRGLIEKSSMGKEDVHFSQVTFLGRLIWDQHVEAQDLKIYFFKIVHAYVPLGSPSDL